MIQAIGTNVIVKGIKEEKKNKIITIDNDKPIYYQVVSMGSGVKEIKIGDHIFTHFRPDKIPSEDDLYVMQEERIYGKRSE